MVQTQLCFIQFVVRCWECKDVVGVGGLGDGDGNPLLDKWGSD